MIYYLTKCKEMKDKKMAYLYLTIIFGIWGSLYVVSKFVLGKIPTFTVSFLRFLIAGVVLYFILQKKKFPKIEPQDYKYVFLIGFLGYFLSNVSLLIGTKLSNASLSSLINSMNPITIILFAAIILKENLTVKKVICIILTMVGVYTIIGGVHGSGQVLGILFSILSVILWSFVSVIVRKVTQKYDAFQITTYAILVAVVCTLPFSIYDFIKTPNIHFDYPVIISLLYMAIVCTAVAHVFWNKSLSMIEAGTCSMFYPVQPMVSVLLGWMFLGESISANFVLGAVLIIGGVLFSIINKKEKADNMAGSYKAN